MLKLNKNKINIKVKIFNYLFIIKLINNIKLYQNLEHSLFIFEKINPIIDLIQKNLPLYLNFNQEKNLNNKEIYLLFYFLIKKDKLIDLSFLNDFKNSDNFNILFLKLYKILIYINFLLDIIIEKKEYTLPLKEKEQNFLNLKFIAQHRFLDHIRQNKFESFKELQEH